MILNFLLSPFSCRHRHLTRPITPTSKPGVPGGDTYVACLEGGKQFAYDWNAMRIGKAISSPDTRMSQVSAGAKERNKPWKYIALAFAVPVSFVIGKTIRSRRRGTR